MKVLVSFTQIKAVELLYCNVSHVWSSMSDIPNIKYKNNDLYSVPNMG